MGEILHTSHISIVREKGPMRKTMIEGFAEPVYYGVHGGIKGFHRVYFSGSTAASGRKDHQGQGTAGGL